MTDSFRAHRGLVAFAVASAIAEAGLLATFAPASVALAAQASSLAPLGVFHDLRWLYLSPRPWGAFLGLLALMIVGRSAMTAGLVRLSWPRGSARPPLRSTMTAALSFTAFGAVVLSPVVSLTFGVAILPFSWPYLAALPAMLAIAVTLSHGGVSSAWWRILPPPAAAAWLLADFAALSVAAALVQPLPLPGQFAVVGAAGLVNARAWHGVTGAVLRAHPAASASAGVPAPAGAPAASAPAAHAPAAAGDDGGRRMARRAPAAVLATMAVIAIVILATRGVFLAAAPGSGERAGSAPPSGSPSAPAPPSAPASPAVGQRAPWTGGKKPGPARSGPGQSERPPATPRDRAPGIAVLVVLGFGSHCCGGRLSIARAMPDARVRQFSYRGLDRAGSPLPYGPAASNLPLPVLGDRIAAQVRRLHASTRRPVDVVAESEGTLGVDAMLARHPDLPVGMVALLSPIVAPGRASYPAAGPAGAVPRAELAAVVWLAGGLSPFGTSGAQTLIGSVNRDGTLYAEQAARYRPSRLLEVVPLADAVTLPACQLPTNFRVLPGLHGRLLANPTALAMVRDFLHGHAVREGVGLRTAAETLAGAGAAWRMPLTASPSPPCAR